MRKPFRQRRTARFSSIETLEDRKVMSGDPVLDLLGPSIGHHAQDSTSFVDEVAVVQHNTGPDFWIDRGATAAPDDYSGRIEQTLQQAHSQTGMSTVSANYGFQGVGQTVAVLDSGIAYDHYALGAGFGESYRVVGGWDFAENDADPYDDSPEGGHGTHVAGIVGGDAGVNAGVATGVDLVALRVFNDAGDGYLSWVENALRWVHDNQYAFENPITAINLSLGTSWNSASIPSWATLEDEFAQLEADGIFISVSAGNSFTSYNEPGLSYPAASPYVVPVMSTDDNGQLSYFSQRHPNAIAAPGRSIRSTVPDYVGNNNGVTDDYANYSGTSMAAPYVAGASVIIREAMEFVGQTNITQDDIFGHMFDTAVSFVDSATGLTYKRLNVAAAIDALMPDDDFGSTAATAHSIGGVSASSSQTIAGVIGRTDDVDYFRFTAGFTGSVTLTADASEYLDPSWTAIDASGVSTGANGEAFTLNVVSGQQYVVALATDNGIGHYEITVAAGEASGGAANHAPVFNGGATGSASFQENGAGVVTTASATDADGQSLTYSIVGGIDALHFVVDTATGALRFNSAPNYESPKDFDGDNVYQVVLGVTDGVASAQKSFAVTVTNANDNAPSIGGGANATATVAENSTVVFASRSVTDADGDAISYVIVGGADAARFSINSTTGKLTFKSAPDFENPTDSNTNNLYVVDIAASDGPHSAVQSVVVTVTNSNDNAPVISGGANPSYYIQENTKSVLDSISSSDADGNPITYSIGGVDAGQFTINASTGKLSFRTAPDFENPTDSNTNNLYVVDVTASDGLNSSQQKVFVYVTDVDDSFSYTDWGVVNGQSQQNNINLNGETWRKVTAGQDGYLTVEAAAGNGSVALDLYDADLNLIDTGGASDRVDYHASAGQEFYIRLDGASTDVDIRLTNLVKVSGGTVTVTGTSGDDTFNFDAGSSQHSLSVNGVDYAFSAAQQSNFVIAGGAGVDTVTLGDSPGDDTFTASPTQATLTGSGYSVSVTAFEQITATATSGFDRAFLYDSSGDDTATMTPSGASLVGASFSLSSQGFDRAFVYASEGTDRAFLYDSSGDDTFEGRYNYSRMYADGYYNFAGKFDRVFAYATSGWDRAFLYDTNGADDFEGRYNYSRMSGAAYYNFAGNFDRVFAYGSGGLDRAFLYDTPGNDTFEGRHNYSRMYADNYYNFVGNFDRVFAYATAGWDRAFLYDTAGNDTFEGLHNYSRMFGSSYYNYVASFDRVFAYASSGYDVATFFDSLGSDRFEGRSSYSRMYGDGFYNYASGFKAVDALFSQEGGGDVAELYGTSGVDTVVGNESEAVLTSGGTTVRIKDAAFLGLFGFDRQHDLLNLEEEQVDYAFKVASVD